MTSPVDAALTEALSGDAVSVRKFSEIAGPIVSERDLPSTGYQVQFKRLHATHGRAFASRSLLIAVLNVVFEAAFFGWLLLPTHLPFLQRSPAVIAANILVIGAIALMEFLRLVNVISFSVASVVARDPVPVAPLPGERIAFVTTIVPSKEPIEMVRGTLIAARQITYDGQLDVWLLDEGDDPAVKAMCAELGVHHFSRKGRPEYNQQRGPFRAKTKHGNYNSWLDAHGSDYSVLMSVDPDHVPLPNYAERILGYFRDPDVAYVVGPQCYANCDNFITKAAESQQFPFHSIIQRAANRYGVAMLVGTNNAIRIEAMQSIGGWSDSVTEDMATGLALHTRRNPATGQRWRSVYTPDLDTGHGHRNRPRAPALCNPAAHALGAAPTHHRHWSNRCPAIGGRWRRCGWPGRHRCAPALGSGCAHRERAAGRELGRRGIQPDHMVSGSVRAGVARR